MSRLLLLLALVSNIDAFGNLGDLGKFLSQLDTASCENLLQTKSALIELDENSHLNVSSQKIIFKFKRKHLILSNRILPIKLWNVIVS